MGNEADVYERMRALNPDRNPIVTAIFNLTELDDIRRFYEALVDYYITNGKFDSRMLAETKAGQDIGYFVSSFRKETRELWEKTVTSISHPVWGGAMTYRQFVEFRNAGKDGNKH